MALNDDSLSYHLYDKLQEFVGTPNIVKIRRFFFDKMNTLASNNSASAICSGSKAEGLNMPGSDLDIMFINKHYLVYNDISDIPCMKNGLYLDTQNTPAGFVQIKLKAYSNIVSNVCLVCTENGTVLENRMFRNNRFIYGPFSRQDSFPTGIRDAFFPTHGPCVSTIEEDYDFLFGLQCQSWPDIASDWISRPRNLEWPPTYLISKILNDKVVLAPIGSKFGSTRDNPNEWRLSFSVAEITLVQSFNHTQLTCYAMLKLMLKEVFDKNPATEKLLCSYFIKTILFWVIEETGYAAWQPHKLVQCFRMCFKRLAYFVKIGQCPNYFVPNNNMFEGKVWGSAKEELSILLDCLYADGINMFLHSKTLSKYLRLVYEPGRPDAGCTMALKTKDVDKAIYPLIHHLHYLSKILRSEKAFYLVTHERHSKLAKAIYMLYLANTCQSFCKETEYNIHSSNKQLYIQFRKCLCYFVMGTYSDAVSGWLLLASFFYRHQHYKKVHTIANFIVSSCLTTDSQLICDELFPKAQSNSTKIWGSFLKRYRNVCVKSLLIVTKDERNIFQETDLETFVVPGICRKSGHSTPAVFAHFLVFMSFHHSGQYDEREKALTDLQRSVEDVHYSSLLLSADLLYLAKALILTNRKFPTSLISKMQSFVSYHLSIPPYIEMINVCMPETTLSAVPNVSDMIRLFSNSQM